MTEKPKDRPRSSPPRLRDHSLFSSASASLGKITSLLDAIRYLDEQPSFLRDEAFHATYGACRDALNGDIASEEARDIFCALLRRRGTLLEDDWYVPIRASDANRLIR